MSGKSADTPLPLHGLETDAVLHAILEGTATETGERFFAALVQNLARVLNTHGAWVTEYFADTRRLRALAFWMDGHWIRDYEVDIGTPCEKVIDTVGLVHFPDRLLELVASVGKYWPPGQWTVNPPGIQRDRWPSERPSSCLASTCIARSSPR